jgi:hypothetical protein
VPSDYDFTDARDQAAWADCCDAVKLENGRDPDCDSPKWR